MKLNKFMQVVGESQRLIIDWCEKGLIVPQVDARGAGSKREFDERCVHESQLIRKLYDVGFSKWAVKKILNETRGKIVFPLNIKLSDSVYLNIEV